ncbi:hypothetical protein UNDKW_5376 [Undibacterium sp. KW1]|uniref:hypothetical protein n=1 Tax=Undibacterium sp. KW1 TaxID=2058624 RepID=UPI001331CC7F|nr:hypothetical protein [Undibacterium sp. KW1]BBB63649.1 hypothetical protein UNDKW_5376 [Undibacterium sp. KW1]
MNLTTSSFPHFTLLTRANLVRLNRILAWAMVITPVLQFFIRSNLAQALLVDFGLLLAHGILSLILFGLPKVKRQKFTFSMHVMGFRWHVLSPRNEFLLTGHRMAQAISVLPLLFIPGARWLALLMFYPLLKMPVTFIQHLYRAIAFAFQRWGIKYLDAGLVVCIYLFFFITNLLRA